jgi:hypothetical protein
MSLPVIGVVIHTSLRDDPYYTQAMAAEFDAVLTEN